MQQLLLWNNTHYATTLASAYGSENVIVNNDQFAAVTEQLDKFSSMIVLCELEWLNNGTMTSRQHLQGIELVKELRRKQDLKIPVLFVSFQSLSNILKVASANNKDAINPEREIMTAIGHSFYHLPAFPKDFKNHIIKKFGENGTTRKLSVMELDDIKSFYCSKEGILQHELHALNVDKTYDELQSALIRIHELFLVDPTNALTGFQAAYDNLTKPEAVEYIKRLGNNLSKTYSEKTNGKAGLEKVNEKYPWKVLFLDDEINEKHKLIKCMAANGIDVICVNTAEKALNEFVEDKAGAKKIMVVIADYRLYEITDEIKHHQNIQGYQFLKTISSTDHLVRLVAFSGLQRKFLLNSFKHYNIRTEVKSKNDYQTEESYQHFTDEIIEFANENFEAEELLPEKSTSFRNSLLEAYKRYRMHPAYEKFERETSLTAKEYCQLIQEQINAGEEVIIGGIDNIKSPLPQPKTQKSEADKKIKGKQVGEKIYDEAYFNRFMNYLVARRIALWLYASNKRNKYSIDSRRIAEILTNQKYPTDAYRQIISTSLGLSLDDFPFNITVEERYWLHYEMELPILRDVKTILPVFVKCSQYLKDFILKADFIKKQIEQHSFKLPFIYKGNKANPNNISELLFNEDFSPRIKTPGDLKEVYWKLNSMVEKDNALKEQLDKTITFIRYSLQDALEKNKSIYIYSLYQYFKGIVATYTVAKNKEAKISKPNNEMIFDLIISNQKLDEKKYPHLINLYGSAFLAKIDMQLDGLELNESTKKIFLELLAKHENAERTDARMVPMSERKKQSAEY
jgi:hypothetical protein